MTQPPHVPTPQHQPPDDPPTSPAGAHYATAACTTMTLDQLAAERQIAWQAGYEAGIDDGAPDPRERMDAIRSDALGKATLAMESVPPDIFMGRPIPAVMYAAYVVEVAHIYMSFLTGDDRSPDRGA